jgi:hypothetical protein
MSGAFSCGLLCGDVVRRSDDHHRGVVRAVVSGAVTVVWLDSGWISEESLGDLVRLETRGIGLFAGKRVTLAE